MIYLIIDGFYKLDFESACLRHAELYLLDIPHTQKEVAPIRSRPPFYAGLLRVCLFEVINRSPLFILNFILSNYSKLYTFKLF